MSAVRGLGAACLVVVAVVLQTAVLSHLSVLGVVPNLCLLVVLAAGAVRGREIGAVLGFCAGLALDLAPPADHAAGRWALALALAGYLAGEVVRSERFVLDPRERLPAGLMAVGGSLVATTVFTLTGVLVHDHGPGFGAALGVGLLGVLLDGLVAMLLLPPLVGLFRHWRPARLAL